MKIKPIKSSYQEDSEKQKRFKKLCQYFKENSYAEFGEYYLHIRHNGCSSGTRWFHRGKYLVDVVVDAKFTPECKPHLNICPWVLFSNFEDAILHMTLVEVKALQMIEEHKNKE